MGIWKFVVVAAFLGSDGQLITPHGDLEAQEMPSTEVLVGDSSLPLMGIWKNVGAADGRHLGGELITPHGDLEDAADCRVHAAIGEAHYPSWGSGRPTQVI